MVTAAGNGVPVTLPNGAKESWGVDIGGEPRVLLLPAATGSSATAICAMVICGSQGISRRRSHCHQAVATAATTTLPLLRPRLLRLQVTAMNPPSLAHRHVARAPGRRSQARLAC